MILSQNIFGLCGLKHRNAGGIKGKTLEVSKKKSLINQQKNRLK
jgi:hypothetical protein